MELLHNVNRLSETLSDCTVVCLECQYHGEPNGCNRDGGSCRLYDIVDDTVDTLERVKEILTPAEDTMLFKFKRLTYEEFTSRQYGPIVYYQDLHDDSHSGLCSMIPSGFRDHYDKDYVIWGMVNRYTV